MKKKLHIVILLITVVLTSLVQGQSDRFAYAVTDIQQEGVNWSFLRKLDLQTGEFSNVLLDGNDLSLLAYDAVTRKQFTKPLTDSRFGNTVNAAFATGVAAMAYDKKNNRIWYTPMFIDQLRYVDLRTMKVFFVTNSAFTGMPEKSSDQGNIVTRMVIAADGNGYAMTNDGAHLIKFTTGKKISITDLGMLVDDPANKGVSIHNSCSSFGGDVIADDDGNLMVFSARNHAFKVNIETKMATHLGVITGLPANFTVNGAAVNENNQIVVTSAVAALYSFTIDAKTLAATAAKTTGIIWRTSDLANSNLLSTGKSPVSAVTNIASRTIPGALGAGKIQTYPNPVTNNQFTIQFNKLEPGNYTIQVTDVMGRQVALKQVNVSGDNQSQNIILNTASAKGIYLVKISDAGNKSVFSKKVVVQ